MSPSISTAIHFQNDDAFNVLLVSPEECCLVPFTSATHWLRLLTYKTILCLFCLVIGFVAFNDKIELHFFAIDVLENLKSWSHLKLPLRSAVEFLWLSVGVTLYCLNVKTFPLFQKMLIVCCS